MSEQEERALWIKTVLDRFWPIPTDASAEVRASLEEERQMVIERGGFNTRPIEQLRQATVSDVTYVWMGGRQTAFVNQHEVGLSGHWTSTHDWSDSIGRYVRRS